MNNVKKTWAVLLGAGVSTAALADAGETRGGLTVRSDDGRFVIKLDGRLHFDAYAFSEDLPRTTEGGAFLRRGNFGASGKLYGWSFKQEFDLAAGDSANASWREAWIATPALGGEIVVGQFKPFRSMEELTSSNETLFMERPFSSATGLYAGRQYQVGLGYKLPFSRGLWATSLVNLRAIGGTATEGVGLSTRLTLTPVNRENRVIHLGLSAGADNSDGGLPRATSVGPGQITIAGRDNPDQVMSPRINFGATSPGQTQQTIALEAAAAFGPAFVQFEAAQSTLGAAAPATDQDLLSYYLAGSYFLTGESKPYRPARGTFGSPRPNSYSGAWELALRYDAIQNDDLAGAQGKPQITAITAGVNWYPNPNVRLMLNYTMGSGETTSTGSGATTENAPDALALRTQLSF